MTHVDQLAAQRQVSQAECITEQIGLVAQLFFQVIEVGRQAFLEGLADDLLVAGLPHARLQNALAENREGGVWRQFIVSVFLQSQYTSPLSCIATVQGLRMGVGFGQVLADDA